MTEPDEIAFRAALAGEPGLLPQLGDLFRGVMGRWTMLIYFLATAVFALGVWAFVRMLDAPDTRALILWTAAAAAAWTTVIALKQWVWARLNTLAILRQLNRIEQRLDRLERG